VSRIERVTHLIGSCLLLPLIAFMKLLHIFSSTPRPPMLDMADHDRSVLNMIIQVSVSDAWTQRAGESTGGGTLHRKKKKNI